MSAADIFIPSALLSPRQILKHAMDSQWMRGRESVAGNQSLVGVFDCESIFLRQVLENP